MEILQPPNRDVEVEAVRRVGKLAAQLAQLVG